MNLQRVICLIDGLNLYHAISALDRPESERPRRARSLSVCEQPQGLPEGYSLVLPQSMGLTVMSASKAPFMIKTVLLRYILDLHLAAPAV